MNRKNEFWIGHRRLAACLVTAVYLGGTGAVIADVTMPSIFGDHMVLQQEAGLPVWGMADAGEQVTVTVGNKTGGTTAGADGKWRVTLTALPAGTAPVTMTVTGKNTLAFSDVLVGDVWVCSGQSNMEFNLSQAHNAHDEVPKAGDPQLRLFHVPKKSTIDPRNDVTAKWELCTPETAAAFTAVGYFFGRDLRSTLNRPIGLIETDWGASTAQAWTSLSGLKKDAELSQYVVMHEKMATDFPAAIAAYPALLSAYQADAAAWEKEVGAIYNPLLEAWKKDEAAAKIARQPVPRQPVPSRPKPIPPVDPNGNNKTPTTLFNGMVAPLIPYGIKGVIWYQGESNASSAGAIEYRILFGRMISDWREKWGEGDFPFLFVQLAGFGGNGPRDTWPFLRESQLKTLALPNTGMASAVDIGDPKNIHPQDKLDVGLRLALAAKHVAYGQQVIYSGPIFDSMKVEGSAIRVSFAQTGGGLSIGTAPWIPATVEPLPTDKLVGFTVAGADKNWLPAEAKIEGNSVIVSSLNVPQPVAVRYAWANAPQCNLYNKENLPASPFRTDDWLQITPQPSKPAVAPKATTKPTTSTAPAPGASSGGK